VMPSHHSLTGLEFGTAVSQSEAAQTATSSSDWLPLTVEVMDCHSPSPMECGCLTASGRFWPSRGSVRNDRYLRV
jgi:hypothetical protein